MEPWSGNQAFETVPALRAARAWCFDLSGCVSRTTRGLPGSTPTDPVSLAFRERRRADGGGREVRPREESRNSPFWWAWCATSKVSRPPDGARVAASKRAGVVRILRGVWNVDSIAPASALGLACVIFAQGRGTGEGSVYSADIHFFNRSCDVPRLLGASALRGHCFGGEGKSNLWDGRRAGQARDLDRFERVSSASRGIMPAAEPAGEQTLVSSRIGGEDSGSCVSARFRAPEIARIRSGPGAMDEGADNRAPPLRQRNRACALEELDFRHLEGRGGPWLIGGCRYGR